MRGSRALLSVLAGLLLFASAALAKSPPTFIVDLDGTIVQSSFPRGTVVPQAETISLMYDGRPNPYRIVRGAPELIESLSKIPGARIYFFSGGTEDRNLELLGKLKTPSGKTFLEVASGTLHRSDLTMLPGQKWGVKDVTRLVPNLDAGETIFIDDVPEYMASRFRANLVHVPGHEDIGARAARGHAAAEQYFSQRNQLFWTRGVIDRALADADAKGISTVAALNALDTGEGSKEYAAYYETGLRQLRETNPALEMVEVPELLLKPGVPPPAGCLATIKGMLRALLGQAEHP